MLTTLYHQHVAQKLDLFQDILLSTGYSEMIIASGNPRLQFQDDIAYPFKANPYFKEWLPLNKRPGCFLHLIAGHLKPRLYLLCTEDIWHTAPQALPDNWGAPFNIIEYETPDDLRPHLNIEGGEQAYIGEANEFGLAPEHCNSQTLLNPINYQRRSKTLYEQACVREANRLAAPAHQAAYQAFMEGASERGICAAYLNACNQMESDMPYPIIAAINEHAAVLHHYRLDTKAPEQKRSFLIDAGVDVNGYASDISRTYAYDENSEFADMVRVMDGKQDELVRAGQPDKSHINLNLLSHLKIAEVLAEFNLIKVTPQTAVETGITKTFYPHSLGHYLGTNVHDKGGRLANSNGDSIAAPEQFPKLGNTTPIVKNQIHTIEPGLYFIPALLNKLRTTRESAMINWNRVDAFIPYGGIRIEDNIIVHDDGRLENLTRNAFAQPADTQEPAPAAVLSTAL